MTIDPIRWVIWRSSSKRNFILGCIFPNQHILLSTAIISQENNFYENDVSTCTFAQSLNRCIIFERCQKLEITIVVISNFYQSAIFSLQLLSLWSNLSKYFCSMVLVMNSFVFSQGFQKLSTTWRRDWIIQMLPMSHRTNFYLWLVSK